MSKVDPKTVSDNILQAISDSQKEYYRQVKDSLDRAPEYFLTVNIGRKLTTILKPMIVKFEQPMKEVISAEKRRGRHKKYYNENGRFDLTILRDEEHAWGIIEVKRNLWSKKRGTDDLKRIRDSLQSDNSANLKFGFFAS